MWIALYTWHRFKFIDESRLKIMEQNIALSKFDSLPLEAQQLIIDIIDILQTRYWPGSLILD